MYIIVSPLIYIILFLPGVFKGEFVPNYTEDAPGHLKSARGLYKAIAINISPVSLTPVSRK